MSRPSASSGSQTARKSPIEGWEVVGSARSVAQARVEGVVVGDLDLALRLDRSSPT